MESDWMGRYRELVAALVSHGNNAIKILGVRNDIGNNIYLSAQEWQSLEYIVEHRNETFSMINMSSALGIPQSSFSKAVKILCNNKLIEKYQAVNNKKNIILKPTELGISLYESYSQTIKEKQFLPFFKCLESVSDKDLNVVTEAIKMLNSNMTVEQNAPDEIKLIKIKEE